MSENRQSLASQNHFEMFGELFFHPDSENDLLLGVGSTGPKKKIYMNSCEQIFFCLGNP